MLEHLELDFEGRPHCGLDDARNIARVLLQMISDGASIQVNERIHLLALETKSKVSKVGLLYEVLILFVRRETH
jgi:3'-5' exoribonuclease 1